IEENIIPFFNPSLYVKRPNKYPLKMISSHIGAIRTRETNLKTKNHGINLSSGINPVSIWDSGEIDNISAITNIITPNSKINGIIEEEAIVLNLIGRGF